MIKEYRKVTTIRAEQFDGSDEMIQKYNLDYEYDFYGQKRFYGIFTNNLFAGDWIATDIKGEHWPIRVDVFKKTYQEVK